MFSKLQFLDAVKNPLQKIKATIKQAIKAQKASLTQIIPHNLYYISPLSSQNVDSFLQELKSGHQFQIWNFSEYSYNEHILTKLLDGRDRNSDGKQIVYNLTYEYFANIPFCEMIKAVQNIEAFLNLSEKNRVYIHCQDNKRRSAVFLASYIFLTGLETDIVSSILKVNKMLNISIQDKDITQGSSFSGAIYKSQHLVLRNLMNYINNSSFINKNAWNLKKILINNAPKIHLILKIQNFPKQKLSTIKFKVLLEIRSAQGIIYKKIFQDQFIQGESLCLRIPQTQSVVLKDDFLIIVKYVYEKRGYSILRAQLNTNFIYDPYFRVQRNDMDLSVNNAHPQNETVFMDLLLEANPNESSDLSQLNILKENYQNFKAAQTQKKEDRKKSLELVERKQNQKSQEGEDDGFGILDEEQEAEHNQKMQRQIEEELARQLQNIRNKRNQDGKKSQQNIENGQVEVQSKQICVKTNVQTLNSQGQTQNQKDSTFNTEKLSQSKNNINTKNQPPKPQTQNEALSSSPIKSSNKQEAPETTQQAAQSNDEEGSSVQSSSSQQESSSEQAQQQEDLDDYLTNLQNQAEKIQ